MGLLRQMGPVRNTKEQRAVNKIYPTKVLRNLRSVPKNILDYTGRHLGSEEKAETHTS